MAQKRTERAVAQPAAGFTLIELAVILVLVSFLVVGALKLGQIYLDAVALKVTKSNIKKVQAALSSYVRANGRLPCPAGFRYTPSEVQYAQEINCASAATYKSSVQVSGPDFGGGARDVRIGAVPTRALNLQDEFMLDGYGTRLFYAVTINQVLDGYNPRLGGIEIVDPSGVRLTDPDLAGGATYALFSIGNDARGGFYIDGSRTEKNCGSGYLGAENCDLADGTFVSDARLALKWGSDYYDEIMTYEVALPGVDFGNGTECNPANEGIKRVVPEDQVPPELIGLVEYCDGTGWKPISPPVYRKESKPYTPSAWWWYVPDQNAAQFAWCDGPEDIAIGGGGGIPRCDTAGSLVCSGEFYDFQNRLHLGGPVQGWVFKADQRLGTAAYEASYAVVQCQNFPPYL